MNNEQYFQIIMYQLVPYGGFKSESGKGKYLEDTTLETWSPMKENDIQHGFIKRGLEIVAIVSTPTQL